MKYFRFVGGGHGGFGAFFQCWCAFCDVSLLPPVCLWTSGTEVSLVEEVTQCCCCDHHLTDHEQVPDTSPDAAVCLCLHSRLAATLLHL